MILSQESEIDEEACRKKSATTTRSRRTKSFSSFDLSPTGDQFVTLRELEERYIHEVLTATGQNKTHAARMLGIHPTSLLRRLKKTHELV